MKSLLDSNIVIDFLSGNPDAYAEVVRYDDCAISVITWMEVMAGADLAKSNETRAVLQSFINLPITIEVMEQTIILRRQLKLKLPDAIILATAQTHGRILVTRNSRDFKASASEIRIPYSV